MVPLDSVRADRARSRGWRGGLFDIGFVLGAGPGGTRVLQTTRSYSPGQRTKAS